MPLDPAYAAANDALEAQYRRDKRPFYKDSNHFVQPVHTDEEWQGMQQQKAQAEADKQAAAAEVDAARTSGRKFVVSKVDQRPIYLESPEQEAAQQAAAQEKLRQQSLTDEIEKQKALHAYTTTQQGLRILPDKAVQKMQRDLQTTQADLLADPANPLRQQAAQTQGMFFKEPTPEATAAQERLKKMEAEDYSLSPDDLTEFEANASTKPHVDKIRRLQGLLDSHQKAVAARTEHEKKLASLTLLRDAPEEYARQEILRRSQLAPQELDQELQASAADLDARKQKLDAQAAAIQQKQAVHTVKLDALAAQAAQRREQGIPAGESVSYKNPDGSTEVWPKDLAQQREAITAQAQAAQMSLQPEIDAYHAAAADYNHLAGIHAESQKAAAAAQQQKQAEFISGLQSSSDPLLSQTGHSLSQLEAEKQQRLADLQEFHGGEPPPAAVAAVHQDIATRQQKLLDDAHAVQQDKADTASAATFARRRWLKDSEDFLARQAQENPAPPYPGKDAPPQEMEKWKAAVRERQKEASAHAAASEEEHMRKVGLDPDNPAHRTAMEDAEAQDFSQTSNFHLPDGQPLPTTPSRAIARTLSDGSIVVNPRFTMDSARYAQAVQAAEATPEAKAKAIEQLPELQLQQAASMVGMLKDMPDIPGIPSFEKWRKATKPGGSEAEQARDYLQHMQARGFWSKLTDTTARNLIGGLADIGVQATGAAAALTGSQGLSEAAADYSGRVSRALAPLEAEGANASLAASIVGQTARLAGPVAATIFLTRGLGGGMATASALSGLQTAGAQYADTYNQLRQQGESHAEAWKQTAPYALGSGLASALITAAGGKIGTNVLLKTAAEKEAAAVKSAAQGFWKHALSNIPKQALGETAEELPDELISQVSEYLATHKDPSHKELAQHLGQFFADSPAFLGSIMLMGGAAGAHESYTDTHPAAQSSTVAHEGAEAENATAGLPHPANRPETIAAAWDAVENLHLSHPHLSPQEQDQAQRRAATALSVASGGSLEDVEESDLRASGWTRQDAHGRTLPPGQYHRLKDYTGPNVLNITQDGTPSIDPAYQRSLQTQLPAVARALSNEPTQPSSPAQPSGPSSGQSSAPDAQPDADQLPVQTPDHSGSQPPSGRSTPAPDGAPINSGSSSVASAKGDKPPQTTANASNSEPSATANSSEAATAIPTTRQAIARYLQERGMPQSEAAQASGAILAHPDMAGKDFDWFYREPVKRAAILDSLGITGSQAAKDASTRPLRYTPHPASGSDSGSAQPPSTTVNGRAATLQPPSTSPQSTPIHRALTAAQARLDDSIPGTPEHTAAQQAVARLQSQIAFGSGSGKPPSTIANAPQEPSATANGGAAATSPQAIQQSLAAKEMTDAGAAHALLAHRASTGQAVPTRAKELADALMADLGWTNYTRALTAAHAVFHAPPLASATRTANRVPAGTESTATEPAPATEDSSAAATPATAPSRAAPSPLRQHSAYSREKLRILSQIHDPARKAWARRFFAAFESSFATRHALYDAIATGLAARRRLKGHMTSVEVIGGRITRLIDFDALLHNFNYLESPEAALAATGLEEDIHAAVFRLAQTQPGKYGYAALVRQWAALPEELRTLVTTAYTAATQTSSGPSPLPPQSAPESFGLMNEFLRMLVQDRHFAAQITETVDPHSSLLQWVKDLLRDLSATLRRLIQGLPAAQRTHLQDMAATIADQLAIYEGRSGTPESQQAQATLTQLRLAANAAGWEFAQSLAASPAGLAALQEPTPPKRRPILLQLADKPTPPPLVVPVVPTPGTTDVTNETTESAPSPATPEPVPTFGGYDRRAAMIEALEKAESEIESLHLDSASDTAQQKLRARLRQQEIAATRARFFLRDNAVRELQSAFDSRRGDAPKAAAIYRVLTGDLGSRRPASGWRTLGLADQRALALLGIGVDQSSTSDSGGYLYTLSRLKHALLQAEFSLAGTPEHQLALQDLEFVRSQPVEWQTSPDPAAPAYVERDHLFIRQSALDTLALTYPAVAAAIPPSESEPSRRLRLGLPALPGPARTQSQPRPTPEESSASPAQATPAPLVQPDLPPRPADQPAAAAPAPAASPSSGKLETSNLKPETPPSLSFSIPLTRRGQVRRSTFPDAESLAAFQFKLDADTASSSRSTPAQVRSAQQRGLALLARLMEDSTLSSQELEQRLLAYHSAVVQQAESASPFGTFTPPSFHSFAMEGSAGTPARFGAGALPVPVGGDILSGMQAQGIRRLGPPDASDGWSWYRQLQADASRSRLKNAEAQRLARAGDITDPKARLFWLNEHVVSQTSGRSIDEAATELSESDHQQFPVSSGAELGQAILDAIEARLRAKLSPSEDPASAEGTLRSSESEGRAALQDFTTFAAGSPGTPFTAAELAQQLEPEDEIQIGSEWFTVQEADAPSGSLTLDSSRFGSLTLEPAQELHLTAGPNHLRLGQPPAPRPPVPEALLNALPPGTQRDMLRPSPLETTLTPLPPGAAATPADVAALDSDLRASIDAGNALDQSSQRIADSDLEDDLAGSADDYLDGESLNASKRSPLSTLEESAVQGYLNLPDVAVPPSKQPAAQRALRAAATARPTPYARDLSTGSGADGHRRRLDALRERALRDWKAFLGQDAATVQESFKSKDSFSNLLHDFVSRSLPSFDIRGAIIQSPADFAAFNLATRSPFFESLKIAVLDASEQVIHSQVVHVGGLNEASADPKVIAGIIATARLQNPKAKLFGWMIAHNHPSGDPTPSDADRRVTRRLFEMGESIGLPLLDHVVTNGEKYFSFREHGLTGSPSIDPSIDALPRKASKPRLPLLPTPARPAPGTLADWEVMPSGTSTQLNSPVRMFSYLHTLRTADPDHYHVLYLDTKNALRAVERFPTSLTTAQLFQRIVLGSAREGANSFALGFPASPDNTVSEDEYTSPSAPAASHIRLVRRLREQSQSIGLQFADAMTLADTSYFSFREHGLMESQSLFSAAVPPTDSRGARTLLSAPETTANNSQPPQPRPLGASPRKIPHPLAFPLSSASLSPDEALRSPAHILASLFPDAARSAAAATTHPFHPAADAGADRKQRGEPRPSVGGRPADLALLLDWAKKNRRLAPLQSFQLNAEPSTLRAGGEHIIIPNWDNDRLYKFTKPGQFGAQALDGPAYLERLALSNRVFGDDLRFEGFTRFPGDQDWRAVISQPFYAAADPARPDATMPAILDWLQARGWHAFEGYHLHPILGLQLWDIQTPGNFIATPTGPMPVDLQLEPADPARLQRLRTQIQQGPRTPTFAAPRSNRLPSPGESLSSTMASAPEAAQSNNEPSPGGLTEAEVLKLRHPGESIVYSSGASQFASKDKTVAMAYASNPGFGGDGQIYASSVKLDKVLHDPNWRKLAEWAGLDFETVSSSWDRGNYMALEEPKVQDWLIKNGYDAVSYKDDFPDGADVIFLVQKPKWHLTKIDPFKQRREVLEEWGHGISGTSIRSSAVDDLLAKENFHGPNYFQARKILLKLGNNDLASVFEAPNVAQESQLARLAETLQREYTPFPTVYNETRKLLGQTIQEAQENLIKIWQSEGFTPAEIQETLDSVSTDSFVEFPQKSPVEESSFSRESAIAGVSSNGASTGQNDNTRNVSGVNPNSSRAEDGTSLAAAPRSGSGNSGQPPSTTVNGRAATLQPSQTPPQAATPAAQRVASAAQRVASAAAETDTSPTPAQKAAGNYAKGKVSLHGLQLSIENPRGSIRSGTSANGTPWSVQMPHHYGYILGTEGRDGDHVDFFLGPNPDSQHVVIINQRKISGSAAATPGRTSGSVSGKPPSTTVNAAQQPSATVNSVPGAFDEHKVMLGFNSTPEALRAYHAAYTPGWKGLQSAVPTTIPAFKAWLTHHDTTQPATRQDLEKAATTALAAAPRSGSGNSGQPPSTTVNGSAATLQPPQTPPQAASQIGRAAFPTLIGAGLGSAVAGPVGAVAGAVAANAIAHTAAPLARASATGLQKALAGVEQVMAFTGLQRPLATLGSAPLDRRISATIHRLLDAKVTSAKAAATAWLNQPEGWAPRARAMVDQTLPTALLPREWLALKHEMDRKSAFGAELSNDLLRALDARDKPRVSDIAYPPEFIADPRHRIQLFDAMEGRLPMQSLPPALQSLADRLRQLLRTTGEELVRQGLMHPDTFEELQSSGWMPRYTEDDAAALGGSFLAQFKLGIQDLRQQRSTAWHIVDTTRKDATGQYLTVNQTTGGRRKWRFSDAAQRDAFYSDFIRQQALEMLQQRHGNTTEMQAMFAPLDRDQRREVRAQISLLTRQDLDAHAKLSPALAGMVHQAIEFQKQKYKKVNPFEPPKLIKDPVYAVARYVLSQTHNAATMELLAKTAATPEWISTTDVQGFTPVPDSARWGPLAGKYVRSDIARQLLDLIEVPSAALQFYDSILRRWKSAKLVWNPASHIRDAVGNTLFAYLAGNSLWNPANTPHYKNAVALLRGESVSVGSHRLTYADLIQQAVLGGDAYSSMVKDRLKGLLPDARTLDQQGASAPSFLARVMQGFGEKFHATGAAASELRRLPDDFYKTAAFLQRLSQLQQETPGADLTALAPQAAEHVRQWFPYYDRLGQSGLTRFSARVVNPFLSFLRESTRIGLLAAHERPLALGAALSFPMALSALSALMLGLSQRDEDEIRKDLAGRGKLWFSSLHPFSMLLPFRSSQGTVQQWDISSVMPFADLLGQKVVPLEEKENSVQTFVRQLLAAGPVLGTAWAWSNNRDTFSGRHIVENDMSATEMALSYAGHLASTLAPPLAPEVAAGFGIGTGGPLSHLGERQTNKTLQTYDTTQTLLRTLVGLNVKSAEPSLYRMAEDFRKAHGYAAQPDFDYGTTATSRLKRLLVQQLAQDRPNPTALRNLSARLRTLGVPLDSEADITRLLRIIDPAQIITGSKKAGITADEARHQFRASLPPAAQQQYDAARTLYRTLLTRAPALLRSAGNR